LRSIRAAKSQDLSLKSAISRIATGPHVLFRGSIERMFYPAPEIILGPEAAQNSLAAHSSDRSQKESRSPYRDKCLQFHREGITSGSIARHNKEGRGGLIYTAAPPPTKNVLFYSLTEEVFATYIRWLTSYFVNAALNLQQSFALVTGGEKLSQIKKSFEYGQQTPFSGPILRAHLRGDPPLIIFRFSLLVRNAVSRRSDNSRPTSLRCGINGLPRIRRWSAGPQGGMLTRGAEGASEACPRPPSSRGLDLSR
jgi:hypothetical protein